MTLNGAIMQLVELRESSMMPEALKPCFDKVIETISECEEPSAQADLPEWAKKVEEYRKSAPDTIYNPLAWALYQTCKEYDR